MKLQNSSRDTTQTPSTLVRIAVPIAVGSRATEQDVVRDRGRVAVHHHVVGWSESRPSASRLGVRVKRGLQRVSVLEVRHLVLERDRRVEHGRPRLPRRCAASVGGGGDPSPKRWEPADGRRDGPPSPGRRRPPRPVPARALENELKAERAGEREGAAEQLIAEDLPALGIGPQRRARRNPAIILDLDIGADDPEQDVGVERGEVLLADREVERVARKLVELRRNHEAEVGHHPAARVAEAYPPGCSWNKKATAAVAPSNSGCASGGGVEPGRPRRRSAPVASAERPTASPMIWVATSHGVP